MIDNECHADPMLVGMIRGLARAASILERLGFTRHDGQLRDGECRLALARARELQLVDDPIRLPTLSEILDELRGAENLHLSKLLGLPIEGGLSDG